MEATSFPLSVTADWLEDGNETSGNQFQQPDWQVGEYSDWSKKGPALSYWRSCVLQAIQHETKRIKMFLNILTIVVILTLSRIN